MNSILIDCEFVQCKKQKLNEEELKLDYAVEDEYGNRYYVYEIAYRAFRKNKVIGSGMLHFHTGFKIYDLAVKSILRKRASFVKKHFGALIGILGLQQRKVIKCVRSLVEMFNAQTLYYKGGICERAIYSTVFPSRNLVNIEDYDVPKNGSGVENKCRLHRYAYDHCAQADVEYYSSMISDQLFEKFRPQKQQSENASTSAPEISSVRNCDLSEDDEIFDIEDEENVFSK